MRMDGEAGLASGRIQRERKRSYKDFMKDLDDTELGVEEEEEQEYYTRRQKEPKTYQKHSVNGMADPEECAVFLPARPNYVPQDGWGQRGGTQEVDGDKEEIGPQDKLLHAVCTAEGSTGQINERSLPQYWAYPDDQDATASSTVGESQMKSPVGSIASPANRLDYPLLSSLSNSVTPIADPLKCPDSALMSNIGSPASSLCCATASDGPTAGAWGAPGCIDLGPANVAGAWGAPGCIDLGPTNVAGAWGAPGCIDLAPANVAGAWGAPGCIDLAPANTAGAWGAPGCIDLGPANTAGAWGAPGCIDLGPANVAAHLHLLGESLSLIGQHLQETNKLLWVSGGMSLLLDSLLCSLAPLTCLTLQIPELRSCSQHTMADTLDNIAYVMPGL